MKRVLSLIFVLTLLCGCAKAAPAPSEETAPAVRLRQMDPQGGYTGMKTLGKDLLLFSGTDKTTLTLLDCESRGIRAERSVDFRLSPEDPSLQIWEDGLCWYDPLDDQVVVLDALLREVRRIQAPEDLLGSPVLSRDRGTLYYAAATGIRAWDLETDLHRCVKEMSAEEQTVTGLLMEDTVIRCRCTDGGRTVTAFLSASTGRLLWELEGEPPVTSEGENWNALLENGTLTLPVFGSSGGKPRVLFPAEPTEKGWFLGDQFLSQNGRTLTRYDCATGRPVSSLTPSGTVLALAAAGEQLWLLTDLGLQSWDAQAEPLSDRTDCSALWEEDLTRCRVYAQEIGSRYGLNLLIGEEAVKVQPWDQDLEGETLAPLIYRELKVLDAALARYPEEIIRTSAANFSSLNLCLVRDIRGSAESGFRQRPACCQFFRGTDAYIALPVGEGLEEGVYHGLFHVMETQIFNESIAFDQWETLNPTGFHYDCDYRRNAQRDAGIYLTGEATSFLDTFSMSFPREDRARIMEYAMCPDQEAVFRSPVLQEKLQTLCEGIREAYGLRSSPEAFPWEQYLKKPLAYQGKK